MPAKPPTRSTEGNAQGLSILPSHLPPPPPVTCAATRGTLSSLAIVHSQLFAETVRCCVNIPLAVDPEPALPSGGQLRPDLHSPHRTPLMRC